MNLSQKFLLAKLHQDRAAGGADRRKLKIKSGDIVTVSLVTTSLQSPYRIIMRFKSAITIQREVGRFESPTPEDAIRLAWKAIRTQKVAEKEGWSWLIEEPETN